MEQDSDLDARHIGRRDTRSFSKGSTKSSLMGTRQSSLSAHCGVLEMSLTAMMRIIGIDSLLRPLVLCKVMPNGVADVERVFSTQLG
jgi:hypothetical protein